MEEGAAAAPAPQLRKIACNSNPAIFPGFSQQLLLHQIGPIMARYE
jgi:hypothetical protein